MMIGSIRRKKELGTAMLELGMLTPILFSIFLSVVFLVSHLQALTATQYAAFIAARSYQVYGDAKLKSIGYKRVREAPYTNPDQTIAEAAAEKVIFESLMWEQKRITVDGDAISLDRYYNDGNDVVRDGVTTEASEGAVRANFLTNSGVEVTYCMPIFFPGLHSVLTLTKKKNPCKNSRVGAGYTGIAIVKEAKFGREPTEK